MSNQTTEREIGNMEARLDMIERDVSELRGDVKQLIGMANQGRGSLWVLMSMGGLLGALVMKFISSMEFLR